MAICGIKVHRGRLFRAFETASLQPKVYINVIVVEHVLNKVFFDLMLYLIDRI